jgi:hypothetical protein
MLLQIFGIYEGFDTSSTLVFSFSSGCPGDQTAFLHFFKISFVATAAFRWTKKRKNKVSNTVVLERPEPPLAGQT